LGLTGLFKITSGLTDTATATQSTSTKCTRHEPAKAQQDSRGTAKIKTPGAESRSSIETENQVATCAHKRLWTNDINGTDGQRPEKATTGSGALLVILQPKKQAAAVKLCTT
jgi:hypothetical protein